MDILRIVAWILLILIVIGFLVIIWCEAFE